MPSGPGKPGLRVRATPSAGRGISPRDLLDERASAWAAYAGDPAFLRAARGAACVSFMKDGGEMAFLACPVDVGSLEEAWHAPDGAMVGGISGLPSGHAARA